MLTHLSLFSGIGCEVLAADWAGIETIAMCEINPWCRNVLKSHWPNIPIIKDVRNVTRKTLTDANRQWQQQSDGCFPDIGRRTDDGNAETGRPLIDILSGGPPCQDVSRAGRRRGKNGDRFLWPETLRIVDELRPTWCLFENPLGIATLAYSGGQTDLDNLPPETLEVESGSVLEWVWDSLETFGYEVATVCIPASAVGAWHRRYRVFVVAYLEARGRQWEGDSRGLIWHDGAIAGHHSGAGQHEAHSQRLPDWAGGAVPCPWPLAESQRSCGKRTIIEHLCDVVHGSITRLVRPGERRRRIEALGNCNPPQMYYPFFKAIKEAHEHEH